MAGSTGFEPATSGLTVQCANQAAPRARAKTDVYTTHPGRSPDARPDGIGYSAARGPPLGRRALERGGPAALLREPAEQIGDLLARRLVTGQIQAGVALERPVHAEEIEVDGLERALLVEPARTCEDLHGLGIGLELALLLLALITLQRGPAQRGVVAEHVMGELVGDDGVTEAGRQRQGVHGEEAAPVAARGTPRIVADEHRNGRQAVEPGRPVREGLDLRHTLLLGRRERGAAGEQEASQPGQQATAYRFAPDAIARLARLRAARPLQIFDSQ